MIVFFVVVLCGFSKVPPFCLKDTHYVEFTYHWPGDMVDEPQYYTIYSDPVSGYLRKDIMKQDYTKQWLKSTLLFDYNKEMLFTNEITLKRCEKQRIGKEFNYFCIYNMTQFGERTLMGQRADVYHGYDSPLDFDPEFMNCVFQPTEKYGLIPISTITFGSAEITSVRTFFNYIGFGSQPYPNQTVFEIPKECL